MKTASNKSPQSDEGRKILYRLLLLAVVVVYALIFVLDYLLKLHFTFFLLLSLFGFVLVMLFYMLFRVKYPGDKSMDIPGEISMEEKKIDAESNAIDGSVFGDAIFIINSVSGKTRPQK